MELNGVVMLHESLNCAVAVLRLIHSARQTYGLRTADYARYHRHCTRKIRSLRIATNSTHKNAKNGRRAAVEYAAPSSSKSLQSSTKQAKPEMRVINTPFSSRTKDVTAALVGKDARHLQILLWEAERAWAEGMRSREELAPLERSANEQSSRTSSLAAKRHRVLKRLQKAASHAQHLVTVVREVPPAELSDASSTRSGVQLSILQADVYKLYMRGTAAFVALTMTNSTSSREAAAHALQLLSVAYILLDAQAESASNVTDSAIAAEFIDELEPMIRFCARSAQLDGQQASILELAKDQMIAALRRTADGLPFQDASATLTTFREVQSGSSGVHKAQRTVQNLREIKWRGIEIPIRNAELARVLSKALSSLAAVGTSTGTSGRRRKMRHAKSGHSASILAMYDRALALLSDSEVCARSLVEENRLALLRAQSARFEASRKPLLQVHEYITFQLLVLRVQRDNLLLRRKLHKLEKRSTNANADRRTQLKNKQGGLQHLPNVLKLLDGILQSLQQARNLQIVEEDVFDLAEQVENRLSLEKARRCVIAARFHRVLTSPQMSLPGTSVFDNGQTRCWLAVAAKVNAVCETSEWQHHSFCSRHRATTANRKRRGSRANGHRR